MCAIFFCYFPLCFTVIYVSSTVVAVSLLIVSIWIFTTESVLVGFRKPAALERHPTARGRATVPRPSHTAALGVPGERTGANAQLGEGGRRNLVPGTLLVANSHY